MKVHHALKWDGEWEIYCSVSETYIDFELGEQTCRECGGGFEVVSELLVRQA